MKPFSSVPLASPDSAALLSPEEGSTTVEYAIGAVSAAAFAGLLLAIIQSDAVRAALHSIIERALSI